MVANVQEDKKEAGNQNVTEGSFTVQEIQGEQPKDAPESGVDGNQLRESSVEGGQLKDTLEGCVDRSQLKDTSEGCVDRGQMKDIPGCMEEDKLMGIPECGTNGDQLKETPENCMEECQLMDIPECGMEQSQMKETQECDMEESQLKDAPEGSMEEEGQMKDTLSGMEEAKMKGISDEDKKENLQEELVGMQGGDLILGDDAGKEAGIKATSGLPESSDYSSMGEVTDVIVADDGQGERNKETSKLTETMKGQEESMEVSFFLIFYKYTDNMAVSRLLTWKERGSKLLWLVQN